MAWRRWRYLQTFVLALTLVYADKGRPLLAKARPVNAAPVAPRSAERDRTEPKRGERNRGAKPPEAAPRKATDPGRFGMQIAAGGHH